MIDIIHLKHSFDKNARWFKNMSESNQQSYLMQSLNSTLCWTNKHDINITITDDITKVTCKKCLKQLSKIK
jgi:hypothetical protein